MAYLFTKDLETGNERIDQQHKALIEAVNNLLAACTMGQGRNELQKTTKFLCDYTTKHFHDEEILQLESRYPDYTNHKKYHENFKKDVLELTNQLQKEGPTVALVNKVNLSIAGWLINHIKREDVKVANHIRSKQA